MFAALPFIDVIATVIAAAATWIVSRFTSHSASKQEDAERTRLRNEVFSPLTTSREKGMAALVAIATGMTTEQKADAALQVLPVLQANAEKQAAVVEQAAELSREETFANLLIETYALGLSLDPPVKSPSMPAFK